jgi:polyhydroxybutyrate depolymerase
MNATKLALLCIPILLSGCATSQHKTDQRINGMRRTYHLHLPSTSDPEPRPLVIALHGAFSTARQMESETQLSRLADRKNFIIAYPNGMGLFGKLQHWNAGHCCGKAAKDNLNDLAFIDSVIADIVAAHPVDTNRIYIIGFSNGGMMAQRYVAERSSTIAAAACVAGAMGGRPSRNDDFWQIPAPETPVPMLLIHSLTDESVPYHGGPPPRKPDDPREYLSVEEAVHFWTTQNHCNQPPTETGLENGALHHKRWSGDAPVELYTLKDWPHTWPPQATDLIWRFFEQQTR